MIGMRHPWVVQSKSRLFSSSGDGDKQNESEKGEGEQDGDEEEEEKDEPAAKPVRIRTMGEALSEDLANHRDYWEIQGNMVKEDHVARVHELWRKDPITWNFERLGQQFGIRKPVVKAMILLSEEIAGNVRNPLQFEYLQKQLEYEAAQKHAAAKAARAAAEAAAAKRGETLPAEKAPLEVETKFDFWGGEEEREGANAEIENELEGWRDYASHQDTTSVFLEDHEDEAVATEELDAAERRRLRKRAYLMDKIRRVPQVPNPPIQFPDIESRSGASLHSPKWKYVFVDISRGTDDKRMESLLVREPGVQRPLRTATELEERQWRAPTQID